LLARFQRRQQVRYDRRAGVAAAVFTGLDLQVERFTVIDLKLGTGPQAEPKRQLHHSDRRI
jgi:hypothetical protein